MQHTLWWPYWRCNRSWNYRCKEHQRKGGRCNRWWGEGCRKRSITRIQVFLLRLKWAFVAFCQRCHEVWRIADTSCSFVSYWTDTGCETCIASDWQLLLIHCDPDKNSKQKYIFTRRQFHWTINKRQIKFNEQEDSNHYKQWKVVHLVLSALLHSSSPCCDVPHTHTHTHQYTLWCPLSHLCSILT